jgi:hypothetical protein
MKFSIDINHPKSKELIEQLALLDFVRFEDNFVAKEPMASYVSKTQVSKKDFDSMALPGPEIELEELRESIAEAEKGSFISFDDWKKEWEIKKKDLLKNIV